MVIDLRGWRLPLATLVLAGGLAAFIQLWVEPAVRGVVAVVADRPIPIRLVETQRPVVALTLEVPATADDEATTAVVAELRRLGLQATFFLSPDWVERHPAAAARLAAAQQELGVLGPPGSATAGTAASGPADVALRWQQLVGQTPSLYRPAADGGARAELAAAARSYLVVAWSHQVLGEPSSRQAARLAARLRPGDILRLTVAGETTSRWVALLAAALPQRGLGLVPAGQLVYRDAYYVEPHTGRQRLLPQPAAAASEEVVVSHPVRGNGPSAGPVFEVPAARGMMSLAINVDWGEEYLPAMLGILASHGVRATFFPTGRWAEKFPELVTRIHQAGHELGNHGYAHDHPTQLSEGQLAASLERTAAVLERVTGTRPRLYAPPYGEWDERVVRHAAALGYRTILWTLDTIDWQRPPAEKILQRILPRARSGAIVLMHPTEPTVAALPALISGLQAAGFRLVPVGELLEAGGLAKTPVRPAAGR